MVPGSRAERGQVTREPADRLIPAGHSHAEHSPTHGSGIESLLETTQGYIVGRLGNKVLRLNTDGHVLSVAPTRSGKGVSCIIPNLLDHPGSAFVIDIRGDTLARTADARLLMGQNVVVLDPYQITGGNWGYDCFNPFDVLEPGVAGFQSKINNTSQAILFDPEGRSSKEPLWDNATRLALNGAITYIKTCLPPERQNLLELRRLLSMSPDTRAAVAREMTQALMEAENNYGTEIDVFTEFMTTGSEKTKIPDNTVIQLMTVLQWVNHLEFQPLLKRSTFSFDKMQSEPTTVYLVLPEEYIKGCEVWVRLLFNAALFQLREVNTVFGKSSSALNQSERVLFLLDEFPAFGKLQPVEDGMATVAGRGATLWLFIQHISQLDRIYGEHSAKQIVGNASLIQAFNSNEVHEHEYFSRMIGEEMFDVESVTIGTSTSTGGGKGTNQSVTVGNSESLSRGTSRSTTTGESHGISHTESRNRSYSTSESVMTGSSEGTSGGTSRQKGSNSGIGDNTTRSTSGGSNVSGDHFLLDYIGIDIPIWKNKGRNEGWGNSWGRSWSQGVSDSISKTNGWTKGTSRSHTKGTSMSEGSGTSDAVSRNWSTGTTEGSNESRGQTTSTSNTTGTNENESWNTGNNVSISVKPEQRKIETPRSLRRSMGNGAQLLAMREHYVFIAPRLRYFERGPDPVLAEILKRPVEHYRFPEMAILAGEITLGTFWESCIKEHAESVFRAAQGDRPSHAVSELSFKKDLELLKDARQAALTREKAAAKIISSFRDLRISLKAECAVLAATPAEHDRLSGILLAYFDFLMRMAGGQTADVNSGLFDQLRLLPTHRGAGDLKPVDTLLSLLLFREGESERLLADPRECVDHAAWLVKQYGESMRTAILALNERQRERERVRKLQERIMRKMNDTIQQAEKAISDALDQAARRQIPRRR